MLGLTLQAHLLRHTPDGYTVITCNMQQAAKDQRLSCIAFEFWSKQESGLLDFYCNRLVWKSSSGSELSASLYCTLMGKSHSLPSVYCASTPLHVPLHSEHRHQLYNSQHLRTGCVYIACKTEMPGIHRTCIILTLFAGQRRVFLICEQPGATVCQKRL